MKITTMNFFGALSLLFFLSCSNQVGHENKNRQDILSSVAAETKIENANALSYWRNVLRQQRDNADLILLGRVTAIKTTLEKDKRGNTLAVSKVDLAVDNIYKGFVKVRLMTFRAYGGTIGDLTYTVSVSPLFKVNEKVIVFLKNKPTRRPFILLGWPAAKLLVDKTEQVSPGSMNLEEVVDLLRE